jgi:hypothetical protein
MSDKFPKPLNVFVDEEIPVKRFNLDPETNKITTSDEVAIARTMYIEAVPEKYRCKTGEHYFEPTIPLGHYIFKCRNCPFSRKVYPTTYRFENGKLIHKVSSQAV